ncbi:papain family cysteine protease domain-containing protein [Phthorimaea operculella]|nr:papain family cysteine protease domain-containing protein [Phthorimaea operculella]
MFNPLYILLPCAVLIAAYHGPDLPPGPYCGKTRQCCTNREDDCSHPILDTLCYCDEHCNRTHDDCCPDYEEVCLGIRTTPQPPPGELYLRCNPGAVKMEGCNEWYSNKHCNRTHDDCCPDYEEVCLGIRTTPQPPPGQLYLRCNPGAVKMEGCNECVCVQTLTREYDWECSREECMMSDEVVNMVNQGEPWRATSYPAFENKKLKDGLVYKLGTLPLNTWAQHMSPLSSVDVDDQPAAFDARSRWPGYISPVLDQGWCGSDWAVAITGVASDRFAIQSNGQEKVRLSPQTLLSCNDRGNIDISWHFFGSHSLLDELCFPYVAQKTTCPYKRRGTLIDDHCRPLVPKRTSRYKVGPPARLKAEKDIMSDIKDSGPVHAVMTVYQDFFHYKSGIYHHTPYGNERLEGLHSVRIVGWGEERGEKYWIVANSWGAEWGEDGYFRIRRGVNESGIESFVVTVLAEVTEA